MSLQLTPDELREVALAIDAYRQALENHGNTETVSGAIRALDSARRKSGREWFRALFANGQG